MYVDFVFESILQPEANARRELSHHNQDGCERVQASPGQGGIESYVFPAQWILCLGSRQRRRRYSMIRRQSRGELQALRGRERISSYDTIQWSAHYRTYTLIVDGYGERTYVLS